MLIHPGVPGSSDPDGTDGFQIPSYLADQPLGSFAPPRAEVRAKLGAESGAESGAATAPDQPTRFDPPAEAGFFRAEALQRGQTGIQTAAVSPAPLARGLARLIDHLSGPGPIEVARVTPQKTFGPTLALSGLDGENGFQINGEAAGDRVGYSVASAGDVNGDGFDDLIIGTYGSAVSAVSAYVVFGAASGFAAVLNLSDLDGANGFEILGEAALDNAGWSVSSAGDINGDGLDDMLIGAPAAGPNGATGAGAAYVIFGSGGGFSSEVDLSGLNGSTGFQINGEAAGDSAGYSVASAGDVNGDGFDDMIIGALGANPYGNDLAGAAYLVFGKAGGFAANLKHLLKISFFTLLATQSVWAWEFAPAIYETTTEASVSECVNGNCDSINNQPVIQKIATFDTAFVRVEKSEHNYAPLGVLSNTKLEPTGTAFLISPCHILTNYHVLYGVNIADGRKFNFNVGQHATADFAIAVGATPVEIGDYANNPSTCEDFAVLELNHCVGNDFGYVDVGPLSEEQVLTLQAEPYNKVVKGASFPDIHDFSKISVDEECVVSGMHALDSEAFGHTCGMTGRSSGGFLSFESRGKPVAFALMSAGMTTEDGRITSSSHLEGNDAKDEELFNKAVPISCIYSRIKQYIGPKS